MEIGIPNNVVQTRVNMNTVYPGTLLQVGSRGSNVLLMQEYLNAISNNYPSIPRLIEDGIFGNNTRNAVVAFQRQFGLSPDRNNRT